MCDLTKFKKNSIKMDIVITMWTLLDLGGNHRVNLMTNINHKEMIEIMMCHHVWLLCLKHTLNMSLNF
jgi:hypothetical protein